MSSLWKIGSIKDILSRHGFTFSKALGQNFLINPSVCPRMADTCGADETTGVIEVGPGIGVLTVELAQRAKKVVAIELDDRLLPVLDETLKDCGNVKVVHADILKVDLAAIIAEEFADCSEVRLCANLPYYITSPVIMRLLESRLPLKSITVMVQKEAAQRLCAPIGSRQSGAVTVAVHYYSQPEMAFQVPRGSFMPAPNVDSAVIHLTLHGKRPDYVLDEPAFFKVVRAAFQNRRKTAVNSISMSLGLPKNQVTDAFDKAGVSPTVRAEKMDMRDFAAIATFLFT